MNTKKIVLLSLLLIIQNLNLTYSTNLFVNKHTGSDSNNGTQQEPFSTISKAIQQVQSGDSITIQGENDGEQKTVYTESVELSNDITDVIITSSNSQWVPQQDAGYAIFINGCSNITLQSLEFVDISTNISVIKIQSSAQITLQDILIKSQTQQIDDGEGNIVGFNAVGINIQDSEDVLIENTLIDKITGIIQQNVRNSMLQHLVLKGYITQGIYVSGGVNITLQDIDLIDETNNSKSLHIVNSQNVNVSNINTVGNGFVFENGQYINIQNIQIYKVKQTCLIFKDCVEVNIENSNLLLNYDVIGVQFYRVVNVSVVQNQFSNAEGFSFYKNTTGIQMKEVINCLIQDNLFNYLYKGIEILLDQSSEITIQRNTIRNFISQAIKIKSFSEFIQNVRITQNQIEQTQEFSSNEYVLSFEVVSNLQLEENMISAQEFFLDISNFNNLALDNNQYCTLLDSTGVWKQDSNIFNTFSQYQLFTNLEQNSTVCGKMNDDGEDNQDGEDSDGEQDNNNNGNDILVCLNSLLPLSQASQSQYYVSTEFDRQIQKIQINFRNNGTFMPIEGCSYYSFYVNQVNFSQKNSNLIEIVNRLSEDDGELFMAELVQLNLPVSEIENLGCQETDLQNLGLKQYTCPSKFIVYSFEDQAVYIQNFNLQVYFQQQGSTIEDSVIMSVDLQEFNSEDQVTYIDIQTALLICSQGIYDNQESCQEIQGTLQQPYQVNKFTRLNLRHKILDNYYKNQFTLEPKTLQYSQQEFEIQQEDQGLGFTDFSFIPTISGDLLEFRAVSALKRFDSQERRFLTQSEQQEEFVQVKGYIKVVDNANIEQQQKINQKQSDESQSFSTLEVAGIIGLSVVGTSALAGISYFLVQKVLRKPKLPQKSKKYEQKDVKYNQTEQDEN